MTHAGAPRVLEEAKGQHRINSPVTPSRKVRVLGGKTADTPTQKNVDGPPPPKPGPKRQKVCAFSASGHCKLGKDSRNKHTTRSPSPGGKGKKMGKGKDGKKPFASAAAAVATSILRPSVPRTGPSSVALAASNYDLGPRENYRSRLLGTGCKYDLATRSSIPQHHVDSIFTAPMPILLATANDLVQGDKVVSQHIGELGEVAEPYVLDSTPTSFR